MPNDCESFLEYIDEHWEDRAPRLVFADWLDEQGEPEEADRQRKWHDAKDWLVAFCREWNFFKCAGGNHYEWNGVQQGPIVSPVPPLSDKETIDRLIDTMITDDEWKSLVADGIDLHSKGELGEDAAKFWQHIEVLTGQCFTEQDRDGFCWSCSC